VEVTVAGQVDSKTGMVCNLVDLDGFVQEKILQRFGHQNLNTLEEFHGIVPTTENLCVELYGILQRDFAHAQVEKVRVEETMLNSFEYGGGREIRH
jgi:6-pyruvoyltetrahydropterin/6-carboxytetrahydropterin synthase